MSKKRKVAKFGLAGALTALYGGAIYLKYKFPEPPPVQFKQTVMTVGGVAVVTWIIAVL